MLIRRIMIFILCIIFNDKNVFLLKIYLNGEDRGLHAHLNRHYLNESHCKYTTFLGFGQYFFWEVAST